MKALSGFFAGLILLSFSAQATQIQSAYFDSTSQMLHIEVAYEGGQKPHEFRLEWDACQRKADAPSIAARLIDSGWDDTGTEPIIQSMYFDLSAINCKPAHLTLRSGRNSQVTLWIAE